MSAVRACSLTGCPRFGTCSGLVRHSPVAVVGLDRCHAGGGNIIGFSRGKTLKTAALSKYGYDTPEAVAGLVRSGKVRFEFLSGRAAGHTPCRGARTRLCLASFCVSAVFLTGALSFPLWWRCSVCSCACRFLVAAGVC